MIILLCLIGFFWSLVALLKTFNLFSIIFLYENNLVNHMNKNLVNVVYKEPRVIHSMSWRSESFEYSQAFVRLVDYNALKERYDKLRKRRVG